MNVYDLGLVIRHNELIIQPGAGSCIFAHRWERPGAPTVGCTAMALDRLRELVAWLSPGKRPRWVQLPIAEYRHRAESWGLPTLPPDTMR